MRTGGKEKFRITVVLTISKCEKKLIPFIIFKGMTFLFTIDDILQLKTNLNFFSLASDTYLHQLRRVQNLETLLPILLRSDPAGMKSTETINHHKVNYTLMFPRQKNKMKSSWSCTRRRSFSLGQE